MVFTEAETAERLFRQGGVVVRRASGERIQVQYLAIGFVFSTIILITIHGRYVLRGWTDCQHSFTAVNFYASISRSDFCAWAHPGSTEYLTPASRHLASLFHPNWSRLSLQGVYFDMHVANSHLTCIFTSLSIKFSYLSTTIYEKEKFQLNQISWNWAEFPNIAERCMPPEIVSSVKSIIRSSAHLWFM